MYRVRDIREKIVDLYKSGEFVTDKTGVKTVELVGHSFLADEPSIFGEPNYDYIDREIAWYESRSLNVNDIPGEVPKIWKQVATPDGFVNSNYGFLVYSEENGSQYQNVLDELKKNPNSRRAVMVYQRPSIWKEYNRDGMSDFICTHAVGYLIRKDKIHSHVSMRSNDLYMGYRNDYAWQKYLLEKLSKDLGVDAGDVFWTATSLHIYERFFHLIPLDSQFRK